MNKDKSKKHISFRNVGLVLGCFILGFVVFTLYLYPILTSKKEDIIIGDENVVVGDEPIDENDNPFIWKASPENSFGYSGEYVVNWSWIENNVNYTLTRDSVDVSDSLIVNFSYVFTNRKYSYEFTSGQKGYFEFTLVFNSLSNSSYIDDSNHTVFFNYSEDKQLFYNFSDIWIIVGQFDSDFSLVDGVFSIVLGRQCNKNVHVVLDPIFGDNSILSSAISIFFHFTDNEFIRGQWDNMGATGGVADNISVYFKDVAFTADYECAIYAYSDYSSNYAGSQVGLTDTVEVDDTEDNSWVVFPFSSSPNLVANTKYYILIRIKGDYTESSSNTVAGEASSGYGITKQGASGVLFDDPLTGESSIDFNISIYCSYTESGVEDDTVVITLIDHSPSNIRINSTGDAWFLYNITTNSTQINNWSIVWAYSINHTETLTHNTSYSLEDPLAEDKLRAYNRNENLTQETKFNSTTGDGSIGGFGEWNTHDLNYGVTIVNSGSNWTLVNATEEVIHHLFNSIGFVDREEIVGTNHTGNTIEISKTNYAKIEFNMTDTDWYDTGHYRNTSMFLHLYANQSSAGKPLLVYFANNSYSTGQPASSPYASLVGSINPDDSFEYTEDNSSYYDINFLINNTGFVGAVNVTSNFSIILRSTVPSAQKWDLYYADQNVSHTVGGVIHYHDYDNHTLIETTVNSGNTWSSNASTPDMYFNFISLNEEDISEVKLYANDTSNNSAWSSVHTDLVDITNYSPNPADIIVPNDGTNYTSGDTIPINYHWIGDPNLDTCWVNISLWDWDITTLDTHIINQSLTFDMVSENNSNFTYNWDTSGIAVSNYTVAINITDPYMLWANSSSEVFYIWSSNAQLFSGWFSGGNLSVNAQLLSGWFSGNNVSNIAYLLDGWFSGGNLSINNQLLSGWFSGGNVSSVNQQLLSGWFSGGNLSINNQLLSGWFSGGNVSDVNQQLLSGWFSGGNTSVINITITDEYPGNGSISIPLQPTAYVTINSGGGDVMNITWYYGTASGAENIEVGTDNNITNGSYTELYYPITDRVTTYYWRVMADDGTSYINESFSFTTEGFPIAPRPPSIGLAIVGIIFGTLGLLSFVMFSKKKKKKKVNKNMYMEEEEWLD